MKNFVVDFYRFVFARKFLYKFNLHLYKLTLRGIGVLNSESSVVSGEEYLFDKVLSKLDINTVFDIGACRGRYSKLVRKHFPEAEIYAFEPHPSAFKELVSNTKSLDIHSQNVGFSDKAGKAKLWDIKASKEQNLNFSSVYADVIKKVHNKAAKYQTVKLTTLDKYCIENDITHIDLLKIDTEGSEYAILAGARGLLKNKKIGVIQFEFNEMNVVSRVFFRDFVDLLDGYKLYRMMPDGLIQLDNYQPKTYEIFAFQNIVAVSELINV